MFEKTKKFIPNLLTVLRLPLAILCCYFAYDLDPVSLSISLGLFIVASATDYFDGYLARRWKFVSTFGKFIDPLADKVLILGVLVIFTIKGIVPVVLTAIIAFREILLTALRLLLLSKNIVLASRYSGKIKTFSQVITLVMIYLILIFMTPLQEIMHISNIKLIILLLIIWIASITVYSGIEFIVSNKKALKHLV
jgi:CDP-diacylglycerol--glycerol-3-phosphate 3-phosphatidyltransferase